MLLYLVSGGAVQRAFRFAASIRAGGGGKLLGGEGNAAEHFAGILRGARRVTALSARNGGVQHRHDQLGIPLQPHNGELPQGHKQPPLIAGEYQLLIKQLPNIAGDLYHAGLLAHAVAYFLHLAAEHHGIQHFHHSRGAVDAVNGNAVPAADAGVAGKHMGLAVFAAQHHPLGENHKTIQWHGSGRAYNGIGQNAVIECNINAVVIAVKCHRLDGGLLRLENFRRRFHRFRHHSHHYHLHHLLQS